MKRNIARNLAALLPVLLGLGLIYLCAIGEMSVPAALIASFGAGGLILATCIFARKIAEDKLVRASRPVYVRQRRRYATLGDESRA